MIPKKQMPWLKNGYGETLTPFEEPFDDQLTIYHNDFAYTEYRCLLSF